MKEETETYSETAITPDISSYLADLYSIFSKKVYVLQFTCRNIVHLHHPLQKKRTLNMEHLALMAMVVKNELARDIFLLLSFCSLF